MTTIKTASRNVAFKAARMSESVLESQGEDEIIIYNNTKTVGKGGRESR